MTLDLHSYVMQLSSAVDSGIITKFTMKSLSIEIIV